MFQFGYTHNQFQSTNNSYRYEMRQEEAIIFSIIHSSKTLRPINCLISTEERQIAFQVDSLVNL